MLKLFFEWWAGDKNLEKVGRFQLENLVENQIRFSLYDISVRPRDPLPLEVERLLMRAEKTSSQELLKKLLEPGMDRSEPIIILCENGKASCRLAKKLLDQQFINVFVVDRGVHGLLTPEP